MKECERPARELLGGVQLRGPFVERHQARAARHKTPGTPPMGLGLVLPGERLVLGWHTLQDKTDGGGREKERCLRLERYLRRRGLWHIGRITNVVFVPSLVSQ